ncbi:Bax inhibitor-1 family protein [Gimesia chilikensis]|jgi:FtsH-binding integral membrane protein|uniref:Bax inhibitor-1/YccA family protein n=1 Tax=Gimesia chilikensis TaxID=2605989 RepID=UPI001189AE91|nr:Bax inhibitor-1 family protein [Gimesia chilikensis]MCR9234172.1 Bax inhibitor-1 family protein [bacterium]QDT83502.1 Modulator of FtsH protease YccA [Gimesia chilikensis]
MNNYSPDYYDQDTTAGRGMFAIDAIAEERAAFIRKTYMHLTGAIFVFMGLEFIIFSSPTLLRGVLSLFTASPWIILIAFLGASWLASSLASSAKSLGTQYLGLGLYTLAEAIIFVPILFLASQMSNPTVIPIAAVITLCIFGGLTAYVLVTGADFSFLGGGLTIALLAAIGIAIGAAIFGISLGLWFAAAMVVLMSGFILYETSNVLHQYSTDQYVSASLALFASVATLFWYVLRIVMMFASED